MFAIRHDNDGAFYTKNYTWNKFTSKNHESTLTFETYAQCEAFVKDIFSDYQRKSIEIVDLADCGEPIKPITIQIDNQKIELPVVIKYIIVHNGYGKFYGKMFTWTTAFSYAMQFDSLEEARQVIKETLGGIPWDLLEIRQLTLSKIEENPSNIQTLSADVITTQDATVNADVEVYRAAIALMCTHYDEETAIATAERVWLKVKHDRKES